MDNPAERHVPAPHDAGTGPAAASRAADGNVQVLCDECGCVREVKYNYMNCIHDKPLKCVNCKRRTPHLPVWWDDERDWRERSKSRPEDAQLLRSVLATRDLIAQLGIRLEYRRRLQGCLTDGSRVDCWALVASERGPGWQERWIYLEEETTLAQEVESLAWAWRHLLPIYWPDLSNPDAWSTDPGDAAVQSLTALKVRD